MNKDFSFWFVWFKLHLTRVWSLINIPVQLFQLLLLIIVSVKNSNQPEIYWLGLAFIFLLSLVLWHWDSKDKGMFQAETAYTMSKNELMLDMDARLKRIEGILLKED